jgi:hypothetical protein
MKRFDWAPIIGIASVVAASFAVTGPIDFRFVLGTLERTAAPGLDLKLTWGSGIWGAGAKWDSGSQACLANDQGKCLTDEKGGPLIANNDGTLPTTLAGANLLNTLAGATLPNALTGDNLPTALVGATLPTTLTGGTLPTTLAGANLLNTLAGATLPNTLTGDNLPTAFAGATLPTTLTGGTLPNSLKF